MAKKTKPVMIKYVLGGLLVFVIVMIINIFFLPTILEFILYFDFISPENVAFYSDIEGWTIGFQLTSAVFVAIFVMGFIYLHKKIMKENKVNE